MTATGHPQAPGGRPVRQAKDRSPSVHGVRPDRQKQATGAAFTLRGIFPSRSARSLGACLGRRELVEVAVRPPQPSDARGVGEPDDGPADFHIYAVWEVRILLISLRA
jgi:hypothetical protein